MEQPPSWGTNIPFPVWRQKTAAPDAGVGPGSDQEQEKPAQAALDAGEAR